MTDNKLNQHPFLIRVHVPLVFALLACLATRVDAELLSIAYPDPSTNAALHYNRAILLLGSLPSETREILQRPVWATFGDSSREEIAATIADPVFHGRSAIRVAVEGSNKHHCNFGIDYADHGNGGVLPHAPLMLELGRLVTLAGIDAYIRGDAEGAAQLFFNQMRMGRHLANQPTLLEALSGLEMMEQSYFALTLWAARCEDLELCQRGWIRLELASKTDLNPARTLAFEAAILERRIDRTIDAYPDGDWAEMLLEAWGDLPQGRNKTELEAKAKEMLQKRGVSNDAFESQASFREAADRFRKLHTGYLRSAAVTMGLPTLQRQKRAETVYAKYKPKFESMGDDDFLDVRSVAAHFATHDAELAMARVAMAVCSYRTDGRFPKSLNAVNERMAGTLPVSPYDGSDLEYEVMDDGRDFMIAVPEVQVGEIVLPRVEFSTVRRGVQAE